MSKDLWVENGGIRRSPRFFRGNILVIAVSNAVKSLGGGLIGTYVSLYFLELGGNPLTYGLMASITLLVQCIMLLLGGFIADYYGRRKIMVLAAFYSVFFPSLYAIVQDWRVFAALGIMAAFGAVSNPASHAVVADSIPPEKRTTGIASLQVLSSLPVIIGPLVGGWLIQHHGLLTGFRLASVYTAAAALASALIFFLFLKETLHSRIATKSTRFNSGTLRNSLKFQGLLPTGLKVLMMAYALVVFANGTVGQYYIIYANRIVGLTPLEWGLIASLQVLLASVLKIPGGWFSDQFGKRKVMVVSVLTCAPCTIFFTLANSFFEVLIVALLLIVTGIYYAPAHEALQADLTPRIMRGRITAIWGMVNAFAGALGTLVGGLLFHTVGPACPFYLFTAAELAAVLLLIGVGKEPVLREV